ncbi:MAG: DUF4184 family protein [Steroidobacteraceae bacterium]
MPFTISHAAAVLPFTRPLARWRLLSAAVIGSMAPDFGWFLPWRTARFETHGLDALLTFCLPVGLATYWLFQLLMRRPIMELLPPGAYARWRWSETPADYRSGKQWIWAGCGILAGAVTHLVWDAFTHEGGRGVRMLPILEEPVAHVSGHVLTGVHLVQDLNSLLGLIAVALVVVYGLRPGKAADAALPRRLRAHERYAWIALYVLTVAALSGIFFVWRHWPVPSSVPVRVVPISGAAIAILRGLAAALVVVSIGLTVRLRRVGPPHAASRR